MAQRVSDVASASLIDVRCLDASGGRVRVVDAHRTYPRCVFASKDIRRAIEVFKELERPEDATWSVWSRELEVDNTRWKLDDDDEFFAAYDRGFNMAEFQATMYSSNGDGLRDNIGVHAYNRSPTDLYTAVRVQAQSRGAIERVLIVFDDLVEKTRAPEPPPPTPPPPPRVFIGHGGRSTAWSDLKNHLQDQHGYDVEAYETGARAGHTIRNILETMLTSSSFALLVLTAEDHTADGEWRARQNVVHEAGLFQGALGFNRAILLVEEGIELASNFDGLQQIRFKDEIRATFGDVLATLRREFPDSWP